MRFDLIIVGGGLVGAGLAVALRHSDLKIALIDARLPSNTDPRLFALNASSCQFLQNINVWSSLAASATSIQQVHVSHKGHFGAVRLRHTDVDLSALGYVIPAHVIESVLNETLHTLTNVTLYRPAKLTTLIQNDNQATLTISIEGEDVVLHSTLVIAADGTDSTVRQQLQINVDTTDYQQSAIVTRTLLQRSHQHIAYERFNQAGAIAMLPLVGNECATIWTTQQDNATALMALTDEEFLQALQQEFGYRLGRLQRIAQRYQFPLRQVVVEKNQVGCVIMLGNSAHTLHPIAAQGFNLALYEVAILVDELTATSTDLAQICARMQAQQKIMIRASHQLAQFFSGKSILWHGALQLGMMGLDTITPLKRKFITGMLGRAKSVPRLLLDTTV